MVVEWCASCAISRTVRLVLPAEEAEVVEEETDVGKVRKENKCCEVADVSSYPLKLPAESQRGGVGEAARGDCRAHSEGGEEWSWEGSSI